MGIVSIFFINHAIVNYQTKKQLNRIIIFNEKLKYEKFSVTCQTTTWGQKTTEFNYRKADLYFLDDALLIAGYFKFFHYKFFRELLVITENKDLYKCIVEKNAIISLSKYNPNWFGDFVYLEFNKQYFTSTNVIIKLIGLTKTEKDLIKFK
ncbi:MAG: hypothetical protein IPH98_01770 [Saprospiraceae bacterium]|nr:hypothetical protein [Candidatus Defluviibacterium haderslevense]